MSYLTRACFGLGLATLILGITQAKAADVTVTQAWSRATPGAVSTGVVYLTIENKGPPDRLLRLSTPVADSADFHESTTSGGMAGMKPVAALPIGQGDTLIFAPGGYHVMLMGLKQPLVAGEHFPVTLEFQKAGKIDADVTVQKLGASLPQREMKGMEMKGKESGH